MLAQLRAASLFAFALLGLAACQQTAEQVPPTTIMGTWRLTVSGGGITGVLSPVPAGSDSRLVFGPDSAYIRYENSKLVEASTYQLRRQLAYAGGPDEQVLVLKTSVGGQLGYYPYYVTQLTAQQLHVTTGDGCAFNSLYERVSGASLPAGNR